MNETDKEIIKFHSYGVRPFLNDVRRLLNGSGINEHSGHFIFNDLENNVEGIRDFYRLLSDEGKDYFKVMVQLSVKLERVIRLAEAETMIPGGPDSTTKDWKRIEGELRPMYDSLSGLI